MKDRLLAVATYSHRALFYETEDELVAGLLPFVADGLDRDDRVVAVVGASVGDALRQHLGSPDGFDLLDSTDIYTSPVRTLAAYIDTVRVGTEDGRSIRVAGEPTWLERSPLEVAEWTCVEAACNVVFAESRLQMLCPYNVAVLEPSIVAAARRTHPEIRRGSSVSASPAFAPYDHQASVRSSDLPDRPASTEVIWIHSPSAMTSAISSVERFAVTRHMTSTRRADLRLTMTELLSAMIGHGRAPARLSMWTTEEQLVCELEVDATPMSPFAGYLPESSATAPERALWRAGQHCDLVAIRQHDRTTIRLQYSDYFVDSRPDCGGIDTLLGAYVLQACDRAETALVSEHLNSCADCVAEVERLRRTVGLIYGPDDDHRH